jgi:hypothetical protein
VPAFDPKETAMTQYMLSVYMQEGFTPSEDEMAQMYKEVDVFNKKLMASGAWVFGGGLHPADTATVVREKGGEVVSTDGPYAETREYLGGFWVIKAADLDEALALASEATVACRGAVEVRPFQDEPEG